ncbi:DMT family transporter [Rhizobium sp. KVB221]|uniref:DMT family transporter n=1 Tax=Rhizobium setariae TaxID=2801340 RepID=A0A936YQT8_9HYPH|nr:DMT family transporter [Rhizobium setariae]MBL0375025.1 DMT family transporter [Rhizobium setariae]
MDQSRKTLIHSRAYQGAFYMVLAGIGFTAINVITQHVTMGLGLSSTSDAFWQYFLALLFSLPMLLKGGWRAMKTQRPVAHLIRVGLAVLGVQAWVFGLANGVPIWQAIALVMTSPFFVTVGAALFLGERVGPERWLAISLGFAGAMVILSPWSDGFSAYALLPVAAAALWGASSLMMKSLLKDEPSSTVTVWLLLLLSPVNAGFAITAGFQIPDQLAFLWLLASGLIMALSQYFLARAYEVADATYVQPFDDLKLPLNVLAGWVVFGYAPAGYLWLGAAMILAASMYNISIEQRRVRAGARGMPGASLQSP